MVSSTARIGRQILGLLFVCCGLSQSSHPRSGIRRIKAEPTYPAPPETNNRIRVLPSLYELLTRSGIAYRRQSVVRQLIQAILLEFAPCGPSRK